jgi:hypothetical protein
MDLPEDTHLAYVASHEVWYAAANRIDHPQLSIVAAHKGGGCVWEFTAEQYELGGRQVVRVKMFFDSFAAYAQMPEFFAALAEQGEDATLESVRAALDSLGAVDETERETPLRYQDMREC